MWKPLTPRQGQYLAFIAQYRDLARVSPSEGDVAHYFGVSGPSAHQMIVALEARSLLVRIPGVQRSARLKVSRSVLPVLGAPGDAVSDPKAALTAFAVYLAKRLSSSNHSAFARFASILQLASQLAELLVEAGATPKAVDGSTKAVVRVADDLIHQNKKTQTPRSLSDSVKEPRPLRRPRSSKREVPPEQGSLF